MTETVARGVFRQLFTAVAGLEELGMVHLCVFSNSELEKIFFCSN